MVDSLKVLDLERPIREADSRWINRHVRFVLPGADMLVDDAIGGDRIGTSRPRGYDYHPGATESRTFICELAEIALKVRTH